MNYEYKRKIMKTNKNKEEQIIEELENSCFPNFGRIAEKVNTSRSYVMDIYRKFKFEHNPT